MAESKPIAVLAALGANLGIAATKFAAFLITGSSSLLAESMHSFADTGNQALLLIGRRRARRAETMEHPFGFGGERYVYGFLVAVVLFTAGGAFSLYEGWQKVAHPHDVRNPLVAFIILGVAVVLEGFSLRTAVHESNRVRGRRSLVSFIRRTKAPELPVVLIEDMAALIGLAFAVAGVTAAVITNDGVWDGVGSLAIGLLLGGFAVVLAVEMKSLLIGESASADTQRKIVTALEEGPEIECVIHLRTLHVGPDSLLVAAKIAVRQDETAAEIARGIDAAEQRVRRAVPIAELIYLEPDLYNPYKADATDPAMRSVHPTAEDL
ncbi:MAG TPA: cation diffusion facilitator family transporter [Streptosporangiaceae bacterium]|nr:cation diffusion facilitator family transporter [Streptosporangiaceae bacterium]